MVLQGAEDKTMKIYFQKDINGHLHMGEGNGISIKVDGRTSIRELLKSVSYFEVEGNFLVVYKPFKANMANYFVTYCPYLFKKQGDAERLVQEVKNGMMFSFRIPMNNVDEGAFIYNSQKGAMDAIRSLLTK